MEGQQATVVPTLPQPTPEPATFVNGNTGGMSSKKILMIVVPIVLILLVAGGGFYWMNSQKAAPIQQVAAPTPTIETSDLNSDLEASQPTDIEGDFTEIDKDLQSL